MTEDEYFNYKVDEGKPVLSSSFLKNGMPMLAGNANMLEATYNKSILKHESPQMRFGSLVHKYAEDSSRFMMMPEFDMSEKIRLIADTTFDLVESSRADIWDNVSHHMLEFNATCLELGWGQSWKEETRVAKFREAADDYWDLRKSAIDKIIVTGDTVEQLNHVIEGIKKAGLEYPVLKDRNDLVRREEAVLFTIDGKYPAKALLDIIEIDHENRQVIITDIKTTSHRIDNFIQGYSYREDEKGNVHKIFMAGDFIRYSYFSQAYFYMKAVEFMYKGTSIQPYELVFQFAVVETIAPYTARMIKMPANWMRVAFDEYIDAIDEVEKWYTKLKYLEF